MSSGMCIGALNDSMDFGYINAVEVIHHYF